MATYARVVDSIVVEMFTPADATLTPAQCFHPDIAAEFVEVPADMPVEPLWTYDGSKWAPPAPTR